MSKGVQGEGVGTPAMAAKRSLWKWLMIIVLALILLGGSGFAIFKFVLTKEIADKASPKEVPIVAAVWPMDPFVVNLLDEHGAKYLKVVIQVEIQDERTLPEFNANKARLRDAVIDLISAKSYKELIEPGGKQQLRDELILRLNASLKEGRVTKIFFTEFIIQ